jgi:hypothetical protein
MWLNFFAPSLGFLGKDHFFFLQASDVSSFESLSKRKEIRSPIVDRHDVARLRKEETGCMHKNLHASFLMNASKGVPVKIEHGPTGGDSEETTELFGFCPFHRPSVLVDVDISFQ